MPHTFRIDLVPIHTYRIYFGGKTVLTTANTDATLYVEVTDEHTQPVSSVTLTATIMRPDTLAVTLTGVMTAVGGVTGKYQLAVPYTALPIVGDYPVQVVETAPAHATVTPKLSVYGG